MHCRQQARSPIQASSKEPKFLALCISLRVQVLNNHIPAPKPTQLVQFLKPKSQIEGSSARLVSEPFKAHARQPYTP